MLKVIGIAENKSDLKEMNYIAQVVYTGIKFRELKK